MTRTPTSGGATDADSDNAIPESRLVGTPLVIMLDVDGTLAPIALHPSLVRVPAETRRVVAALAARPDIAVALVSGRAAHDARRLVAVENVWTIGNHGAEVMHPNGDITIDPAVAAFAQPVASAAHTLAPLLAPLRNVLLENKGLTLSIHYRTAAEAIVPRLRAAVDGVAARYGLRVTDGKMVFEMRPPTRVDKGTAVYRLARDLGALGDDAALVFAGDDVTDEDAFRLLRSRAPRAVTVHVGEGADTAAEFTVASPDDIRALLDRIAALRPSDR